MLAIVLTAQELLLTSEGVQLTPTALAILGGTILPLLVAASSHITSSGKAKTVLNVLFSVLVGTGTYLVAHEGSVTWTQLLICVTTAFGASGVSNNHLWKQLNVTAWIAIATKHFGLGRDQALVQQLSQIGITDEELKKVRTSPVGFHVATAALIESKK